MTIHLSAKNGAAFLSGKSKRSKYGAKRTLLDGILFDSKAEANFYAALKQREKAGEVTDIERQREYDLMVNGVLVARYRADFMVHLRNGLRFAVECDGVEFHDSAEDTLRDMSLYRRNHLRLLRATGAEIFESPLWTNGVRKMVFTICGFRDEYGR
jgi:hypothetical protein